MKSTGSIIVVVVAALLGLLFGNALGGLLWAVILGVGSAAAAYLIGMRFDTPGSAESKAVEVQGPRFARFLFSDPRSAALWLPIRVFLGWEWIDASLHKLSDPKWMDTGEALKGFWLNAVKVPDPGQGRAAITYDWWRNFLQWLLDMNAYTWFAKVISVGEFLVGLGLIVGALVGIAAFSGALMNMAFLLSGSASTNPVLLILAIFLVLAWKVAGWIGVDRYLLPILGTPWQGGALFHRGQTQAPTTGTAVS